MEALRTPAIPTITVTLEPGDEVTESIRRACDNERVSSAFIIGSGEVEDVEVLVLGPVVPGKVAPRTHKKIDGPSDLVSLIGHLARGELELRAVVARETEQGSVLASGVLVRATAVTARVSVQPVPAAAPTPPKPIPSEPSATQAPSPVAPPVAFSPGSSTPQQQPAARMPVKPMRPNDEPDAYPEENDTVNHFHFGKCTVLSSDGERLRLQQERDGRVREVALSMLRVENPTVLESGHKHWELSRKN